MTETFDLIFDFWVDRYSDVDWKTWIGSSAGVDSRVAGTGVKIISVDAGVFRVALQA